MAADGREGQHLQPDRSSERLSRLAFEFPGGDAICNEPELSVAIVRGLQAPQDYPEVKAGLVP
jgi:hypothetical protein